MGANGPHTPFTMLAAAPMGAFAAASISDLCNLFCRSVPYRQYGGIACAVSSLGGRAGE